MTLFLILAFLAAMVLLIAYVCYRMAFFASREEEENADEFAIPEGDIYEPFRDVMVQWMKEARAMPHDEITIQSFDGLTLCGKYYEFAPGAPIELMFHGYRGNADRDLCGGVQRCFSLGHSALIVDQRTCGKSGGKKITFGVWESKDCLSWLDYMVDRFGPGQEIILCGISMGAATVTMAAGLPLPANVTSVLADCGYTSAKEIIQKVIAVDMKLPPKLAYPFVKLGAKVFGGFDLEENPPIAAVTKTRIPIIFIHGGSDAFVPCDMSRRCHEANRNMTRFVCIPGAGHGLSYLVDKETYLKVLREFWNL